MAINTAAGQFNRRITVERLKSSVTVDAAGHVNQATEANWETYCTLWASIKYGAGRESLTGDQLTAADAATVLVRSADKTRAITTDMRFKTGTRIFSISTPPVDVDEARKVVRFTAVEVRV